MIVFKVLRALLAGLVLLLVITNWVRPALFRFEFVGRTRRPGVLSALDARLVTLEHLTYTQLLQLPEFEEVRARADDRDVLFQTLRRQQADEDLIIVVCVLVRETGGIFARPVGVAARGFRVDANGARTPLSDEELDRFAGDANAGGLYVS